MAQTRPRIVLSSSMHTLAYLVKGGGQRRGSGAGGVRARVRVRVRVRVGVGVRVGSGGGGAYGAIPSAATTVTRITARIT